MERCALTLLLGGAALAGVWALARILGREETTGVAAGASGQSRVTPSRGGLRRWALRGIAIGIIANGTGPALLTLAGKGRIAYSIPIGAGAALLTVITYIVSSYWEEAVFRGYILRVLRPLGIPAALVASSILFAGLHFLGEPTSVPRLVFLFGLGLLFGGAYLATGDLAFPLGIHLGVNGMHLALGGDPMFPAIWPFVTRFPDGVLLAVALLSTALALGLALHLVRSITAQKPGP